MARTKIDVQGVINANGQINSAKRTVNKVREEFDWTSGQISSSILNRSNLRQRIRSVSNSLATVETRMSRIRNMVEHGANSYKNTDRTVVTWRASLNGKIAKKVVAGVGVGSLITVEAVKQVVDKIELDEKEIYGVTLTEAQKKAILEALKRNDKEAAMNALGLSSTGVKSAEAETLIDTLWEDLCNGFKDNIIDDTKSGLVDEGLESGGNWIAQIVAGRINIQNAIAHGPATANSFVLIDPNIASKTATMAKNVSTGLKWGIPIVGGIIDFAGMKIQGEDTGDALIKATAHVGIGLAGGKAGAAIGAAIGSVIPGAGTVVGGAIGFVAGVAITTVGNAVFDTIYDNREAIGEAISDTWNAATDWVEEKGRQVGEAVDAAVDKAKDWLSDVGDAWSSGWKSLGSVFG